MDSEPPAGPEGVGEAGAPARPPEAILTESPPPAREPAAAPSVEAPPPPPAPSMAVAPPRAPKRRRRRVLIAIGIVVVLLLAGAGAGAAVANASLSATYSPQRAVTDYFAAQKRGDAAGMFNNATFLKGDGAVSQYFDQIGVDQMLKTPGNTDLQDVKITSTQAVNDSTQSVTVSMTWGGKQRTQTYNVRKDLARVHYSFYYSWRVDIPYVTVGVKAPNQAGLISLDGLLVPPTGNPNQVQAIQGFHSVTMNATFLYDASTQVVDAVDSNPTATFPSALTQAAIKAAEKAINATFLNCDTTTYFTCFNHTYSAPNKPGFIYYWTVPGSGDVEYTTYVFTEFGDPTADIKIVVGADPNKLTASGTCQSTLTFDGSKSYRLKGDWTSTLTLSGTTFSAGVIFDCSKLAA